MRCVILGGAGFLGRHVGTAMAAAGNEVWSVDRVTVRPAESAEWLAGEVLTDFSDVASWWPRTGGADVLVHLASTTVPATASADPLADVQGNLLGSLRLLHGLRQQKARPRLLFASSGGAVYGRPQSVPLAETHPTLPMGAYGVTKLAIEHYLRIEEAQHGLPQRVLRLSNPYGPGQRPHAVQGVVAVFAHRALHGLPLSVWGDGSVVRDFVYAGDIGRAFVAAAQHAGHERVFNIGAGSGLSVNDIIAALERLLGVAIAQERQPGRPFDPPVNVLDTRRAHAQLGWQPAVDFDAGLARTLDWLRTQP
ncbi:MAG: NAD-dependent epimerase/dehydratase family protein [Ottowia sp.]|nr:NAD-dependent epimerase/dehydratase family protein [Ottowia sp.]